MSKQCIVTVWNTVTYRYEETAVTQEVYDEYRRGEWRIGKNDDKHCANETPFSALIGGEDGNYENFREFISYAANPENIIVGKTRTEELLKAVASLSAEDHALVQALFYEGLTEREYAEQLGVFRNAIHKRKVRILGKLKNFLEI